MEEVNLNKTWSQLSKDEQNSIYSMYQGFGRYYTDITRTFTDFLFKWIITLNFGGLASTITLLASVIEKDKEVLCICALSGVGFLFGITLLVLAAHLEHLRFGKR